MKKVIIVVLFSIGLTAFAQQENTKRFHEQPLELKLKKMTEELSLNAEQQKQVLSIFEEQKALRKLNKENSENKEANRGKMREIIKKIENVLTPDQYKIWKANVKKRHNDKKMTGKEAEVQE